MQHTLDTLLTSHAIQLLEDDFVVVVQVQADNVTWQCCFCHTKNSPAAMHDLRVCIQAGLDADHVGHVMSLESLVMHIQHKQLPSLLKVVRDELDAPL